MSALVRGLSWDHPRGHAPLVAASDAWAHARGEARVEWTRRSLSDFAGGELAAFVGEYDIVACDHPLIGRAAAKGWLQPLRDVADVFAGSSYVSYQHDGRLWAAPVDAAALTFAYRPDLLPEPPGSFADLLDLARRTGRVAVPLSTFSAVALYATFCAEAGADPFDNDPQRRIALDRLSDLAPWTCSRGSVDLLRTLATSDELLAVAWPYGYSTYGRAGVIGARVAFIDPPSSNPEVSPRPTLGGVGLGLLTDAPSPGPARELLDHLVSGDVQRGIYATAGGQPAHASAWTDPDLDQATLGFYSGTRVSLENAYVRPRGVWFDHAQPRIGATLQDFVAGRTDAATTLDLLDSLVQERQ